MKSVVLIKLLLATCFGAFLEEDDVLVLTTDTFQNAIDTFQFIMVEFYAPWCGHCKKLAPEYSAAATELKNQGIDNYVRLAKVDATVETSVAKKYSIQGYPTIKFFINGEAIDYEGGRIQNEIVNWILKKKGPPSTELNSVEDLETFLTKVSNAPVVIFFGSSSDDNDFETYKQFAKQNDKIIFGHTFNPQSAEQYRVTEKIVLFKSFDEQRNDFSKAVTLANLESFINQYGNPIVLPFDDKAIKIIFQQKNNAIILFTDDSDAGVAAFDAFVAIAGLYKDKIKFSFSKPNDGTGLFHRLAEYIGANSTEIPNIMIYEQSGGDNKFRFEGEITTQSLRTFLSNYFQGKLARYYQGQNQLSFYIE